MRLKRAYHHTCRADGLYDAARGVVFTAAGAVLANSMMAGVLPVLTLIDGEIAFRQHTGGHTTGPNCPAFLTLAERYIKAPPKAEAKL